jgi:hypothetical protein
MKRKIIDVSSEQKIITAMVVSKEFLAQTWSVIDLELFKSKPLKQVARWCISYYQKYQDAPKRQIESIYYGWVGKGKASEDMISSMSAVLEYLSTQYEENTDLNVPYLLDVTAEYFNLKRIEQLKDELEYSISEGSKTLAEEAINKFSTISAEVDSGSDFLNDENVWDLAYADSQKPLITWGDAAADRFFGSSLSRDSLVAILSPEKRGKTWWCIEFVMRALMQRKKVALFEVGDMSKSQVMRRFGVRLSKRPMFKRDLGMVSIPCRIGKKKDQVLLKTKKVECSQIANAKSSKLSVQRFMRAHGIKPKQPHVMISAHPNSSINVQGIAAKLTEWEVRKNFIPDIVIIDYPDILDNEPGTTGMSTRDQVNMTWKALRRLSQEKHCLVLAPTQADMASNLQNTLNPTNFSEDKRKLSHVTGMIGLNQIGEEKRRGIMRLNWIVLREEEFLVDRCLYVGTCFKLGRVFCCSCM